MSALGTLINDAVATAIAAHPKLFASESAERAQKVLTREIIKSLTKEPKTADEGGEPTSPVEAPPAPALPQRVSAKDDRVTAYVNLRTLAGAVQPTRLTGGDIYLPPEADTAAVRAFAELPQREKWLFVSGREQLAAWLEFFDVLLPNAARRQITVTVDTKVGAYLPWPWPPSKLGKTYSPEDHHD